MDRNANNEPSDGGEVGNIDLAGVILAQQGHIRIFQDMQDWHEKYQDLFEGKYKRKPSIGKTRRNVEAFREKKLKKMMKKYGNDLHQVGLDLELTFPFGEKGEPDFDDILPQKSPMFLVRDGTKFLNYLDAIIKRNTPDKKTMMSLVEVTRNLMDRLRDEYDLHDPESKQAIELCRILEAFEQKMETLQFRGKFDGVARYFDEETWQSFQDDMNDLRTFAAMSKQKCLREFIEVCRANMFSSWLVHVDNKGDLHLDETYFPFAAQKWHLKPATLQEVQEKWFNAIESLEKISKNPHAAKIRSFLRSHLLKSLAVLKADVNAATLDLTKRNQMYDRRVFIAELEERLANL